MVDEVTALLDAPAVQLRDYQEAALDALFDWFQREPGDALCVLPTGAGKSIVMGSFIARARSNYPPLRAVILAMRAELVKQNVNAAARVLPRADIGIYSASLNIKQTDKPITVANIQSLAKKVYGMEPPDIICLDEAQNLADAESGLLRTYFAAVRQQNPHVKIVGFTATPYKLSSGRLDQGENALFSGIAYEASVVDLIAQGYLCRPITPRSRVTLNTDGVGTRGGDFILRELANAVDVHEITKAAVAEDVELFKNRHHWVVFAITVEHAQHIAQEFASHGIATAVVHGELSRDERAYRLDAFHRGEVRCLVNCMLLTEGWDEPQVDAISIMRPSKSAGLYVQVVGRGMRVHPSKTDCLISDHAGLVSRFGPVDAIVVPEKNKKGDGTAVAKTCPQCETMQAAGVRFCVNCNFEFPPPAVTLNATASTAPILSTDQEPEWYTISETRYSRHPGKKQPDGSFKPDTLRAAYYAGYKHIASEWVCIEHQGWARRKAESWWSERCGERCPVGIDEAIELLEAEGRAVQSIALLPDPANPKYQRITAFKFAGAPVDPRQADAFNDTALPRACWTCTHWCSVATETEPPQCGKYKAVPPADVQATGCPEWSDEDELPF